MSSLQDNYDNIANPGELTLTSPVTAISAGEIIIASADALAHNFAGVVFYSDAEGQNVVLPSAMSGTVTITVKTSNQPHAYQDVNNGTLPANKAGQADWSANTKSIRATFSGITGATHAQLIVTQNRQ